MTTSEERQKVLEMVAAGSLSAAEAAAILAGDQSLDAMDATDVDVQEELRAAKAEAGQPDASEQIEVEEFVTQPEATKQSSNASGSGRKAKWLHIRVTDSRTGRGKVTVNIPLRFVKLGLRLGSAMAPELRDIDLEELNELTTDGEPAILVDVQDEMDGEHVQIYVD